MSRKQLQGDIRKNSGFILSDGTCNLRHLLPKAYDLIKGYNIQGQRELCADILKCFIINDDARQWLKLGGTLFSLQYHGQIELDDTSIEQRDLMNGIWNEDIYELFNNIAPAGYYFGSSEGDGACIGWFKSEEE